MSLFKRCIDKIHTKNLEEDALGKAKQFALFSIARPHMRSFHASWFCFFMAFTSWFGLQPLVPTIQKELKLSKIDIANSGIASVAATIAIRIIIGPLCDRFGPRRTMSGLLIAGAIPMALAGLVKDGTGLIIIRFFIGFLGGTFVPCQFWTSAMFSPKIVGTANAVVGGWGNVGGGVTFLLMPGLFQLIKVIGADEFLAWKLAVVVPALICIGLGISIIFTTDDCPKGHWTERNLEEITIQVEEKGVSNLGFEKDLEKGPIDKKGVEGIKEPIEDSKIETESKDEMCTGEKCWSVLTVMILMIQYGLCFGVEIAVNTVLNLYFLYRFKKDDCNAQLFNATNVTRLMDLADENDDCSILDQDTASLIASLFGLMNLFARAMGGIFSDVLRKYFSLAGRFIAHFTSLLGEGFMLIIFSQMTTIPSAIGVMILFSTFVEMSAGTTYAIVPYVSARYVGIVSGFVGAGGNAGALIWNTIWRQYVEDDPSGWFWLLGIIVLIGTSLTLVAVVQQQRIWHAFKYCKNNNDKYEVKN